MTGRLGLTLTALALLQPALAHADPIEFSYSVSVTPSAFDAGSGVQVNTHYTPSGAASAILGGSTLTSLPSIEWRSSTPANLAGEVSFDSTEQVNLTITDHASGQSGLFSFAAHLHGSVFLFDSEVNHFGYVEIPISTQNLQLGNYIYHYSPYIPPTTADLLGEFGNSMSAQITVTSAPAPQTPEPSCLVLGAMAACGFTAMRWCRHRSGLLEGPGSAVTV